MENTKIQNTDALFVIALDQEGKKAVYLGRVFAAQVKGKYDEILKFAREEDYLTTKEQLASNGFALKNVKRNVSD